jgi:hypothetical protein
MAFPAVAACSMWAPDRVETWPHCSRTGSKAYGVKPSEAMRAEALEAPPRARGTPRLRCRAGARPAFGGGFDGVLCSAVLMHLAEAELFDAAFALRDLLRPHGRLLVSLPLARTDVGSDNRDGAGAALHALGAGPGQLLFERLGFIQIGRWDDDDALGRTARGGTRCCSSCGPAGLCALIDQIEGILNRDRKVATYKLALFCALAELATQEPWDAHWRADGTVGVPIRRIAEKWLLYFWPLFASATGDAYRAVRPPPGHPVERCAALAARAPGAGTGDARRTADLRPAGRRPMHVDGTTPRCRLRGRPRHPVCAMGQQ